MRIQNSPMLPYDQGMHWQTHAAYFERRGVEAWTTGEIPSRATNNFAFARQHGALLVELVQALVAEGRCGKDEHIQVLEIGGGLGDFAVKLLLALKEDLGEAGRAVFDRVRYVFTDASRTSLEQAVHRPGLAGFVASGHVLPALLDARAPAQLHTLGGDEVALKPTLVVANYICCVLPTKVLRKQGETWLELYTHNGSAEDDVPAAPRPEAEQQEDAEPWQRIVGEHAWLPRRLEEVFPNPLHPHLLSQVLASSPEAEVAYPHVFLELLDTLRARLTSGGALLFSDFEDGSYEGHIGPGSRVPVFYGETLNHPVCFPLFAPLAHLRGDDVLISPSWYGATRTVLWRGAAPIPSAMRECFLGGFSRRNAGQDRLDFESAARALSEAGEHKRALRFYDRCLALDPHDPTLYAQAANAALALDEVEVALRYLREGSARDRFHAHDFELQLGEVHCRQGALHPACKAFEASLLHRELPLTHVALGKVLQVLGDYPRAFHAFTRALELDPALEEARQALSSLQEDWCEAELQLRTTAEQWWEDKLRALVSGTGGSSHE